MTLWIPGLPKEEGVYWYDSGHGNSKLPAVLQVRGDVMTIFGDFASMPLSSIYVPSMADRVSYTFIEEPEEWKDYTCIQKSRSRAWVKTPGGMIGFGLLNKGWHNDVSGTWLWPAPHINSSECGRNVRDSENYLFSLVEIPKVKVKK